MGADGSNGNGWEWMGAMGADGNGWELRELREWMGMMQSIEKRLTN